MGPLKMQHSTKLPILTPLYKSIGVGVPDTLNFMSFYVLPNRLNVSGVRVNLFAGVSDNGRCCKYLALLGKNLGLQILGLQNFGLIPLQKFSTSDIKDAN